MCQAVETIDSGSLPPELPDFKLYVAVGEAKELTPDEIERTASIQDSKGNVASDEGIVIANRALLKTFCFSSCPCSFSPYGVRNIRF
jgi:hypothetical protein